MAVRRSRRAALCVTALTVLVVTPLAGADTPGHTTDTGRTTAADRAGAADQANARAAQGNRFKIPPFDPANYYQNVYQASGKVSAQASKLKTTINLPDTRLLAYTKLCVEIAQQGSIDLKLCPPFHPPATSYDASDSLPVWIDASGPLWVESPRGASRPYGVFPSVRVRTVAFGSVPISATVTVSQPIGRDGYVVPLEMNFMTSVSPAPAEGGRVFGNRFYDGFVIPPNNGSLYVVPSAKLAGLADVTVTDVEIDGRAVDVGPSCRTATPGRVTLVSPPGAYSTQVTASQLRGRPGGAQPLSAADPGSLQGSVSIPPFSGCRNGGEDLDPLLNAFVSGPNNPLDVPLTSALTTCNSLEGTPRACPPYPRKPAPGVRATARSAASPTARAATPLTEPQRRYLVRRLRAAPPTIRAALLAGLPATISAALRSGN